MYTSTESKWIQTQIIRHDMLHILFQW